MKLTSNYNLKKPEGTDIVNINDFNDNVDIIDTQLKNASDHSGNKNNPHGVTKAQVGLSNVDNVKQASKAEFDAHLAEKVHQGEVHGLRLNGEKELQFYNGTDWRDAAYRQPDDATDSPGGKFLLGGTLSAGFFGEVPASQLLNGTQLASAIGLTAGTAYNSSNPYLKFIYEGKILYVAKRPFRYNLSWDNINAAGAVFGKTIAINGIQYKVRIMRGALVDPYDPSTPDGNAMGSEWNRLILPLHERAISGGWDYPKHVENNIQSWKHNFGSGNQGAYTDADLLTSSKHGNGADNMCQETRAGSPNLRAFRGRADASFLSHNGKDVIQTSNGWRPVLERI